MTNYELRIMNYGINHYSLFLIHYSRNVKSNWLIAEKFEEGFGEGWPAVRGIGEERNYSEILLQLFWNREIKSREAAETFLNPDYAKLYDPFLFPDMKKACERILAAAEKKETVFIFADYDADGVPGAVILYTAMKACGITPKIYIPHREKEGYGLNIAAIDYMKAQDASLFITCDLGISNNKEIAYAKNLGLQAIITDHHTLPLELTGDAYAIIHPQAGDYPFKGLSGGGVAFKLAQGLLTIGHPTSNSKEKVEKWLLDLAAISTVADMMPLMDENRILVNFGLKVLNKTKRLGLRKLIEAAGLELGGLDTHNIGFQIAPRINAAGRMDHANAAFELLICEDEAEAEKLAENLNKTNSDRQRETNKIVDEAKFQIVEAGKEKDYCLFAFKPDWPLGLLGLAASKIKDIFNRPVVLMTEIGGEIKGSARSVENFSIISALQKSEDLFSHYGGHPMAAGLALKNKEDLKVFQEKMIALAKNDLQDKELEPLIYIDMELPIEKINLALAEDAAKLAPFGDANPEPLFLSQNLTVRGTQIVGNGTKHLRLMVSGENGIQYKMMGFYQAHWHGTLKLGDKINAVYELGVNEWNGRREPQMKIKDLEKVNNGA